MPPGGEDQGGRTERGVEGPLQFLRFVAAAAVTVLVIALLGLALGPKDPGTVTLYVLVIGLNLLIALAYWPAIKYLRRHSR